MDYKLKKKTLTCQQQRKLPGLTIVQNYPGLVVWIYSFCRQYIKKIVMLIKWRRITDTCIHRNYKISEDLKLKMQGMGSKVQIMSKEQRVKVNNWK